jgi:hypothetical protein
LHLGYTGAFSGDTQKFNVHDVGRDGLPRRSATSAKAGKPMITWVFNGS